MQDIQSLEAALEEAKEEHDTQQQLAIYPDLANRYLNQGDAPQALTYINQGIDLSEKAENKIVQARLLGLKGMALRQIGNPGQALKAYRSSQRIAEPLDHKPIWIDALSQIGKIHAEQQEYDKAVVPLEKAYRMAYESQDTPREMFLAGLQGDTYQAMSQFGKAMEFYTIGLEKAQELGNKDAQCSYHIAIGKIYVEEEAPDPAHKHFKHALDIGSRMQHAGYEFQAFENLLHLNIRQDDLDAALKNGEHAIQLAWEIEDPGAEAACISNLTDYLIEKGEYQTASRHLDRGLELAKNAHDQEWQLKMTADKGIAHYYMGSLEEADDWITRALETAVHLQKDAEEMILRSQLSAIKADLGRIEESLALAEQSLDLAQQQDQPIVAGDQYILIAMNHYELDNREQAQHAAHQALELYRDLERDDLVERAQTVLEGFKGLQDM